MINGEFFAPKLITLDKRFNIVKTNNNDSFKIIEGGIFQPPQYQVNFTLDVRKTPYFIIYTDNKN